MNKTSLVAAVAEKTGVSKKDVDKVTNAVFNTIGETMEKGEKVQIIGFGTFETRQRKARMGRNPKRPDEKIQIPASTAPAFKAGKALKDTVNKK